MTIDLHDIKDGLTACLAVGLVDLRSGALLEACADGDDAIEHLVLGCGAARGLLEAPDAHDAAAALGGAGERGAGAGPFQEIVIRTGDMVHVLRRVPGAEPRALLAICAGVTNLGSVLVEARAIGRDGKQGSDGLGR